MTWVVIPAISAEVSDTGHRDHMATVHLHPRPADDHPRRDPRPAQQPHLLPGAAQRPPAHQHHPLVGRTHPTVQIGQPDPR